MKREKPLGWSHPWRAAKLTLWGLWYGRKHGRRILRQNAGLWLRRFAPKEMTPERRRARDDELTRRARFILENPDSREAREFLDALPRSHSLRGSPDKIPERLRSFIKWVEKGGLS